MSRDKEFSEVFSQLNQTPLIDELKNRYAN